MKTIIAVILSVVLVGCNQEVVSTDSAGNPVVESTTAQHSSV